MGQQQKYVPRRSNLAGAKGAPDLPDALDGDPVPPPAVHEDDDGGSRPVVYAPRPQLVGKCESCGRTLTGDELASGRVHLDEKSHKVTLLGLCTQCVAGAAS